MIKLQQSYLSHWRQFDFAITHYVPQASARVYSGLVMNGVNYWADWFSYCHFSLITPLCETLSRVRYKDCSIKSTVEPCYNEDLGTIKLTLLYQVCQYIIIRVKRQRNIKSWDQQNYLVIRGFSYIRPLYNEVPLYMDKFKNFSN